MKGRKKGTQKTGGRSIGVKNKITVSLKETIEKIVKDNLLTIQSDLDSLEPKDRLIMIEKLFKYTIPTLQATTLKTDFEKLTDSQIDNIINELKETANE
jgi:hypothetical protein